jgi:hypothetical protein
MYSNSQSRLGRAAAIASQAILAILGACEVCPMPGTRREDGRIRTLCEEPASAPGETKDGEYIRVEILIFNLPPQAHNRSVSFPSARAFRGYCNSCW